MKPKDDLVLGPAGSNDKAQSSQFIGGEAPRTGDLDLEASIKEFSEGQSTDVLDESDLEMLGADEIRRAGNELPTSTPPQTPPPMQRETTSSLSVSPEPVPAPAAGVEPELPNVPSDVLSTNQSKRKRSLLYGLLACTVAGGFAAYTTLGRETSGGAMNVEGTAKATAVGLMPDNASTANTLDSESEAATPTATLDKRAANGTEQAIGLDSVPTKDVSELVIESVPSGATIYLDGARLGQTPHTLAASSAKHQMALLMPEYSLFTGEIDGAGTVKIELTATIPSSGRGGIKVRCKKENHYRVFLDGIDTGQLCPTERLGVNLGHHSVEIYDPSDDSRRAFEVDVNDTKRSVRVRVD